MIGLFRVSGRSSEKAQPRRRNSTLAMVAIDDDDDDDDDVFPRTWLMTTKTILLLELY